MHKKWQQTRKGRAMQIITVGVFKGGVAKTTTAAAIAEAAQTDGKRVLAIDLDPQADLSSALAADPNRQGSFDIMTGTAAAANVIQRTATGVDAITASENLAALEKTGNAYMLADALAPIKDNYDLIIIDTPTAGGMMLFNALQASTGLIIPLKPEKQCINGLYRINDTVSMFAESNPNLTIYGYILSQLDNTALAQLCAANISNTAKMLHIPFIGNVRKGVKVAEAIAMQTNLYKYAPKSNPALDYMEIWQQIKRKRQRPVKKA